MVIEITYEDDSIWVEEIKCKDINEICWEGNRYHWDGCTVHDDKIIKDIKELK